MRHLSNAVPLLSIVSGVWIVEKGFTELAIVLVVILLVLSILKLRRILSMDDMAMVLRPEVMSALTSIQSSDAIDDRILCTPLDFTYAAGYFTGLVMVQSSGGSAKGLCYNLRIHEAVAKKEYDSLVKVFGVRWIFAYDENVPLSIEHNVIRYGEKVTILEVTAMEQEGAQLG